MLFRSVYEKRKLRTVSPSVLNFLWGSEVRIEFLLGKVILSIK